MLRHKIIINNFCHGALIRQHEFQELLPATIHIGERQSGCFRQTKTLHIERSERCPINHRLFESLLVDLLGLAQIAHQPPGKGIAGTCGIYDPWDRIGRERKFIRIAVKPRALPF